MIETFFTSTGPGGMVVLIVIGLAATIYTLLTRWIIMGSKKDQET